MRIAIIGTGISGLAAAHRLHRRHALTLFEANDYIGGHTATVDVEHGGRSFAIDTGFIVFNDWTYPRFARLLDELGVVSQDSHMSFSLRCERSGLEYNGSSLDRLFAQRRNLLRPSFLRMLSEILRFNRRTSAQLNEPQALLGELTLGEYLARQRYSRAFIEQYIVPMGRAIWSAGEAAILNFPMRFFVEFFARHGFLSVNQRPQWRAVRGGSRTYVERLIAPFRERIRLRTPIVAVKRSATEVILRSARGECARFDAVIFACHADQALRILEDPSRAEREVLGAFAYQRNEVVLHTDVRMLPRSLRARAAWNYHLLATSQEPVALTYDMNVLMSLEAPLRFLVTLNRADIDAAKVLRTFSYHHPVYSPTAVAAQARRCDVSGVHRTAYCGAYWGYGFHEDGLVSGEAAAADIEQPGCAAPGTLECCA